MKQVDENTIGGRIRIARKRSGLTTTELARTAGISINHASMIELGKRNPSDELLAKIAEITQTPYAWLETGEGQQDISEQSAPVTASPVNEASSLPDPQLFLMLLKWQRPDLFPDTVQVILDVTPDTLDALLDGKADYEPQWRSAFDLLAQRMDRATIRDAFNSLDAFLQKAERTHVLQSVHTAVRRFLDAHGAEEYKLIGEQASAEQRDMDGATLELHTLTFACGRARWQFKYVEARADTAHCGDFLAHMDGEEVTTIIREQLDCAVSEQVSLVFKDVGLYNLFERYAGKVQVEAEESGHLPEGMENLSFLLVEKDSVSDYTPLCREQ